MIIEDFIDWKSADWADKIPTLGVDLLLTLSLRGCEHKYAWTGAEARGGRSY
jgi:hypothetical protein